MYCSFGGTLLRQLAHHFIPRAYIWLALFSELLNIASQSTVRKGQQLSIVYTRTDASRYS